IEVEVPSGRPVARFGTGPVNALAITRERIYGVGEDAQQNPVLIAWERDGDHGKLGERAFPAPIADLLATQAGELAVLSPDKLRVLEPDGKLRFTLDADFSAMALAPDGRQLFVSYEGSVKIFDLDSGRMVQRIEAGPDRVELAVHPRAAVLATAG